MAGSAAHRSALRLLRLVNDINLAAGLGGRGKAAMGVAAAVEAATLTVVVVVVVVVMALVAAVVVAVVVVVRWACTH